ncbi:MAG: helix-turn-helix domain-containing protein [Acidimicrobiales bacterium]
MPLIGTPEGNRWRLIRDVAIGGVHPTRRRMIEFLVSEDTAHTTATIAARCRLPQSTVRRYLEDLVALEILELIGTRPEEWKATAGILDRWPIWI